MISIDRLHVKITMEKILAEHFQTSTSYGGVEIDNLKEWVDTSKVPPPRSKTGTLHSPAPFLVETVGNRSSRARLWIGERSFLKWFRQPLCSAFESSKYAVTGDSVVAFPLCLGLCSTLLNSVACEHWQALTPLWSVMKTINIFELWRHTAPLVSIRIAQL